MWYKTEGGVRPKEVDETISDTSVFLRKNIEEVQREVEGETVTVFVYDELKIPKELYPVFEQQQADIDYLTMIVEG
ncbi:MAG: hypothetical protein IJ600_09570 [Lachnospiraceae bacterium]|nr:hypothetical protein [Lachnospiraceae bacterium]